MKKICLYIVAFSAIMIGLSSCGTVEFLCGLARETMRSMDNCDRNTYDQWRRNNPDADDKDFKGYQFRKDSQMSGLIRSLEASKSGGGGLAMSGIKVVGNVIGSLGGLDMNTFNQVMDNSMNGLIADKHASSSNEMNIVGALAHSGEQLLYLVEDKYIIGKEGERSSEYIQQKLSEVSNPASPFYDPYFDCKYEIVTIREGKYGSSGEQVIRRRDQNCETFEEYQQVAQDMMKCIQEVDNMLAEQSFIDYMQSEYGVYMTNDEYSHLPDSEKPSIENFVFPSHKPAKEILNETTPIDELISSAASEDSNSISSILEESVKAKELATLEQTKVNLYKINSYELSEKNKLELDKAAEILANNPEWTIELRGHCCDLGDDQTNYSIGLLRAKEAMKYLVKKGVGENRISAISMGSKQPLVVNDSPANRAQNRRVEIFLVK